MCDVNSMSVTSFLNTTPEVEGVVILEFPSFAEAKAWYDSPAHREVREHRFRGADYRAVIVAGARRPIMIADLPSANKRGKRAVRDYQVASRLSPRVSAYRGLNLAKSDIIL